MAKPYYEQLEELVKKCELESGQPESLEVKHLFSGAALYSRDSICSSLSPMGLAFKLSDIEAEKLIKGGKAVPLKYFGKGNIKKGYAMFQSPNLNQIKRWKSYFIRALELNNKNDT